MNAAVSSPVPARAGSCHHGGAKPYLPYFVSAMFVMLLAGVGWGSALLLKLVRAGEYTGLSLHEINAHGHAMLSGFIQLFIVGFAYQAFPRLLGHPLLKPEWCKPVLGVLLLGLLLSVGGQLLNGSPAAVWITLVGDLLEIVALLVFAGQMSLTFAKGSARVEPHLVFIGAATFFMVASACFSAWLNFVCLRAEFPMEVVYYVSTYQPALRYLQMHGIVLLMILGVGHRLLTNFFAFQRTSDRWMYVAIALLASSVVAEALLFTSFRITGQRLLATLLLVPWLGLIVGVLLVVGRWRLWRRPRDLQGRTDRMGPFVQASFAWLAVALLMTIALPFWNRLIGTPFSHSFYGSTRQAFAFGFATMMIVAFTLRIVPTLNSIVPTRLKPMSFTFWTLNLGCALHVTSQVASDLWPTARFLLPLAAAMELIGMVTWVNHVLWCIREGRASEPQPARPSLAPLRVLN